MARIRAAVSLAAAVASVSLLSACGGSYDPFTSKAPAREQVSAAGPPQQDVSAVRLAAKQVGKLGTVVTDANGMTLYRFDRDTANPPTSNCDGTCPTTWPPLVAADAASVRVTGVDANLVKTVTRRDGTKQVTLNGWPLYRYTKDTAPGEANGQAQGGTWFAVTPVGRKAAGTAPQAGTAPKVGYP